VPFATCHGIYRHAATTATQNREVKKTEETAEAADEQVEEFTVLEVIASDCLDPSPRPAQFPKAHNGGT